MHASSHYNTVRLSHHWETCNSHSVGHELKYSILSAYNLEILVLTVQDVSVSEYLDSTTATISASHYESIPLYINIYQNRYQGSDFTQLPVYLNITLLPCPLSFMLSSQPAECVCHTTLQYHNISCTIDNQWLSLIRLPHMLISELIDSGPDCYWDIGSLVCSLTQIIPAVFPQFSGTKL